MLSAVEKATGYRFSSEEVELIGHGADENDLVNSGLEDTMINAYHEIRETHKQRCPTEDLRTASFITAIDKIAASYRQAGIFP
ncbi:hypothetical protein C6495_08795 [Candidatus Poribacteria bacterium]|nr:MAG: hypothetical protein C6495_08795 [Candidatus Poribacteria bacterium]